MQRPDGRRTDELRAVHVTKDFNKYAEGSVLIEVGDTKVICTASVEDRVPPWMRGLGKGWVTAEYSMLPRATAERNQREASRGRLGGRTMEIQRLIGRSMRSVVELDRLGERTMWLDCDVIQADGGTRTTSITGAWIAMVDALRKVAAREKWSRLPLAGHVASTSVGILDGVPILDLSYAEDSRAQVDMNIVMTGDGRLIEIQGTAEEFPFSRNQMNTLLDLAESGVGHLVELQREVLGLQGDEEWKHHD